MRCLSDSPTYCLRQDLSQPEAQKFSFTGLSARLCDPPFSVSPGLHSYTWLCIEAWGNSGLHVCSVHIFTQYPDLLLSQGWTVFYCVSLQIVPFFYPPLVIRQLVSTSVLLVYGSDKIPWPMQLTGFVWGLCCERGKSPSPSRHVAAGRPSTRAATEGSQLDLQAERGVNLEGSKSFETSKPTPVTHFLQ